jgi:hypothetical protein
MLLGISDTQLQPMYAIDGSETTRYTSGQAGIGNEWLQIDLCRPVSISGITAVTNSATDLAASYTMQVSTDGATWTTVATSATPALQRMTLTFTPVLARYVRYNQTGVIQGPPMMMPYWWSVHEFAAVCGGDAGP